MSICVTSTFVLYAGDKSKCKSFDLSTLGVSLFAFNQFAILSKEMLMLFFNWLMLLFAQKSAVSSAKMWNAAIGPDLHILLCTSNTEGALIHSLVEFHK